MTNSALAKTGITLLVAALILVGVFAPFVLLSLLPLLPLIVPIVLLGWGVWVIVLLRDIRYELRILREQRSAADVSGEARW